MKVDYPIVAGVITNWVDFEEILRKCFVSDLQCDPTRIPVFLLVGNFVGQSDVLKLLDLLLGQFKVPLARVIREYEALIGALNLKDALCVFLGDSGYEIVPVVDGSAWKHAMHRVPLGGQNISAYLGTLLREEGLGSFETRSERRALEDMKRLGEVAGPEEDLNANQEKLEYIQSDGTPLAIPKRTLKQCNEVLFKPELIGLESTLNLPEKMLDSLKRSPEKAQEEMAKHIVLCGGVGETPGFKERLLADLKSLHPKITFNLHPQDNNQHLLWQAASRLAANNKLNWSIKRK
uniref:Actin-related protein 5 n=1 Tax=Arcella intermedia TaxID=1963864 RepID=A0A6B2L8Y0_9EUKA